MDEGSTYLIAGMLDKALARFEAAAAATRSPAVKAAALRRQADVLRTRCQWDDAVARARRAQDVAAENDLPDIRAEAVNSEAAVYHARGDLDRATELYE